MGGKTDSLEPCYARRQFLLQHCHLRVPGIDKHKTSSYIISMINHISPTSTSSTDVRIFPYLILNCSGLQVPARPVGAHHVPGQPGQRGWEGGEESIFIYLKLLFLYQKVSKLKQTILLSQEIEQQHCLGHNWDNCWAKRNIFSGNLWLIFLMIVSLRL